MYVVVTVLVLATCCCGFVRDGNNTFVYLEQITSWHNTELFPRSTILLLNDDTVLLVSDHTRAEGCLFETFSLSDLLRTGTGKVLAEIPSYSRTEWIGQNTATQQRRRQVLTWEEGAEHQLLTASYYANDIFILDWNQVHTGQIDTETTVLTIMNVWKIPLESLLAKRVSEFSVVELFADYRRVRFLAADQTIISDFDCDPITPTQSKFSDMGSAFLDVYGWETIALADCWLILVRSFGGTWWVDVKYAANEQPVQPCNTTQPTFGFGTEDVYLLRATALATDQPGEGLHVSRLLVTFYCLLPPLKPQLFCIGLYDITYSVHRSNHSFKAMLEVKLNTSLCTATDESVYSLTDKMATLTGYLPCHSIITSASANLDFHQVTLEALTLIHFSGPGSQVADHFNHPSLIAISRIHRNSTSDSLPLCLSTEPVPPENIQWIGGSVPSPSLFHGGFNTRPMQCGWIPGRHTSVRTTSYKKFFSIMVSSVVTDLGERNITVECCGTLNASDFWLTSTIKGEQFLFPVVVQQPDTWIPSPPLCEVSGIDVDMALRSSDCLNLTQVTEWKVVLISRRYGVGRHLHITIVDRTAPTIAECNQTLHSLPLIESIHQYNTQNQNPDVLSTLKQQLSSLLTIRDQNPFDILALALLCIPPCADNQSASQVVTVNITVADVYHNSNSCVVYIPYTVPGPITHPTPPAAAAIHKTNTWFIYMVLSLLVGFMLLMCLLMACMWQYANKRNSVRKWRLRCIQSPKLTTLQLADLFVSDEVLGAGGQATVYKGLNKRTGQLLAVKVYKQGTEDNREFKLLAAVNHTNVVPVYAFSPDTLVMRFMAGGSLLSLVQATGRLQIGPVLTYGRQILSGLGHLHQHRILHRDLKPSNILLDETGTCHIADLGMATRIEQSSIFLWGNTKAEQPCSATNCMCGSIRYLPPELVVTGKSSTKSDIWMFGLIVVFMITGKEPWHNLQSVEELLSMFASVGKEESAGYPFDILAPVLESGGESIVPLVSDLLDKCLSYCPDKRATISSLLQHKVFREIH